MDARNLSSVQPLDVSQHASVNVKDLLLQLREDFFKPDRFDGIKLGLEKCEDVMKRFERMKLVGKQVEQTARQREFVAKTRLERCEAEFERQQTALEENRRKVAQMVEETEKVDRENRELTDRVEKARETVINLERARAEAKIRKQQEMVADTNLRMHSVLKECTKGNAATDLSIISASRLLSKLSKLGDSCESGDASRSNDSQMTTLSYEPRANQDFSLAEDQTIAVTLGAYGDGSDEEMEESQGEEEDETLMETSSASDKEN